MTLRMSHFELYFIACTIVSLNFDLVEADPQVIVSTPVTVVKEGGIFSVHCQIWNLDLTGHDVEIVRIFESSSQRLSVDTDIHAKADDRFYLAVRTLPDSSIVYFMSLIDVSRADEAEYACKIISTYPTLSEIASDSKPLDVTYYPASHEPRCEDVDVEVTEGQPVTFECSAESAYPPIKLYWTRPGSLKSLTNEVVHSEARHGRTYSTITLTPSADDDDFVLFCHIESSAFPGRDQSCHVGPFKVKTDESIRRISNNKPVEFSDRKRDKNDSVKLIIDAESSVNTSEYDSVCHTKCPEFYQSNAFYWVVSTAAAGLIAFVFFIIIILLSVQYYYQKQEGHVYMRTPQHEKHSYGVVEDIYTSLDRNMDHGKMYMMLGKSFQPLEICSPDQDP